MEIHFDQLYGRHNAGCCPIATFEFVPQPFNGNVLKLVPSHAVYGFGITPIGLSVEFARTRRLHPFLLGDGGIIASTEPIPENVTNATALNFLFDFGGGLRWNLDARHAVSFGYRFLHISNAGTTNENPGVDNNVFYVGFSFLR